MKRLILCLWWGFLSLTGFAQTPVLHLPFSGNLGDSSGNGNHGTVHGSPTSTTDRYGVANRAYNFNPTGNGDYITIDTAFVFQPRQQLTLATWVCPRYRTDGGWMSIISKRMYTATDPWDSYGITTNNSSPISNKWIYNVSRGTAGTLTSATALRNYSSHTWLHIVGTYDGANLRTYINGELHSTTPFTGNIGYSAMKFHIAYSDAGIHEYYQGKIDDIKVFDEALTGSEISDMYNETQVISLVEDTISVVAEGGDVGVKMNCITAWEVLDLPSWITIDQSSGEMSDSLILTVDENTGFPRTADITFKAGAQSIILHVQQFGPCYNGNCINSANTDFTISSYMSLPDSLGGNIIFMTQDNGSIGTVDRMRVTPNGNVGIGTAAPVNKLQIGSNPAGYSGNDFLVSNGNGSVAIYNASDHAYIGSDQDFAIKTANNAVVYATSGGKVGFGTTTPNFLLHANGSGVNSYQQFTSSTTGATTGDGLIIGSGDAGQAIVLNRENTDLQFMTNSSLRMTVSAGGFVGIGTATPSERLSVNGNISAKKIRVTQAGWSDFVFADGYRLRSLPETEKFIRTNKHLPGIPTAAEVEKNGQDVGEMNKLLLQKVEELTLHLITQDKKITTLVAELEKLKRKK